MASTNENEGKKRKQKQTRKHDETKWNKKFNELVQYINIQKGNNSSGRGNINININING